MRHQLYGELLHQQTGQIDNRTCKQSWSNVSKEGTQGCSQPSHKVLMPARWHQRRAYTKRRSCPRKAACTTSRTSTGGSRRKPNVHVSIKHTVSSRQQQPIADRPKSNYSSPTHNSRPRRVTVWWPHTAQHSADQRLLRLLVQHLA